MEMSMKAVVYKEPYTGAVEEVPRAPSLLTARAVARSFRCCGSG